MDKDKRDPIIVSAVRTPIGDFGGALRDVSHTELAALVMAEVCRRADFPKGELEDVYWGVVMPRTDENGLARAALLEAGIPDHVSSAQVSRACCSSMEVIRIASMAIRLGEANAAYRRPEAASREWRFTRRHVFSHLRYRNSS